MTDMNDGAVRNIGQLQSWRDRNACGQNIRVAVREWEGVMGLIRLASVTGKIMEQQEIQERKIFAFRAVLPEMFDKEWCKQNLTNLCIDQQMQREKNIIKHRPHKPFQLRKKSDFVIEIVHK